MVNFIAALIIVSLLSLTGSLVGMGTMFIGLPFWAAIASGIFAGSFILYMLSLAN